MADELAKAGFQIERKRIELPGNSFKSVGKYKVTVKLYENTAAELTITVQAQVIKAEERTASARKERRPRDLSSAGTAVPAETAPPVEVSAGTAETAVSAPNAVETAVPAEADAAGETVQETVSTEAATVE